MLQGSQVHSTLQSFLSSFFSSILSRQPASLWKVVCFTHNTQRSHGSASLLQMQLKKKKFNRYSSNSKKKSEENTYVVTSAQKCSGELNHIITDAFILYGRYWRVYRRRLITFTLKVYEEMFTRQSWAVNPDFRHVLVSITSDWHAESHDRNVVVYRMRRVVGLWDSWQEEAYKPLTPLSIVEH